MLFLLVTVTVQCYRGSHRPLLHVDHGGLVLQTTSAHPAKGSVRTQGNISNMLDLVHIQQRGVRPQGNISNMLDLVDILQRGL